MTYAFGDFTITTWGEREGKQVWRARSDERVEEFLADHDADIVELIRLGRGALGLESPVD